MTDELRCWCRHCKAELPPDHKGPCPECGKLGKDCKVTAKVAIGLAVSAYYEQWREHAKNHPLLIVISFVLTLASPIVGYLLVGWIGILIGVIISILAWWLGLNAREKIRELKSRGDKRE